MKILVRTSLVALLFSHPALADLYQETWPSSDIKVGDISQGYYCSAQADTASVSCNLPATAKYGTLNNVQQSCVAAGPTACYSVQTATSPHKLNFHGETKVVGGTTYINFPLISKETYDKNHYISVEATINAYCGPAAGVNCFAGLTLFNGEANYREIAYANPSLSTTNLEIQRVTNCEARALVGASTGAPLTVARNTAHKLRLDYYGHVPGGKWVYFVDDIVQWISSDGTSTEPPYVQPACNPPYTGGVDYRELQANPHVGLYFVGDVAYTPGNYVEGSVGPVSIYTKEYQDQAQTAQTDGIAVNATNWVAQLVQMGSATPNITMAKLFLINNETYTVEAYRDMSGHPGTLINSTSYKADTYGLQYVPLWVPAYYGNVWIVVKGKSSGAAVGTTTNGSQPYAKTFLFTSNSGGTWTSLVRNLTFATYSRQ